jgi:hypothetical protein
MAGECKMIPLDIKLIELEARRNFVFQILTSQSWPIEVEIKMNEKLQSLDKEIDDLNTLDKAFSASESNNIYS